jgi:hypothetical protein
LSYARSRIDIMKRAAQLLGVAAAGLLASACASHLSSQTNSATILAQGPQSQNSNQAAMAGRTAMAWGDAWTAQRLFRRAEAGHDSPSNRFNVAAGYQNTGRLNEAAAIYQTLLVDGRYTWVTSNNDIHNPNARTRRFNIAEESRRRLVEIADAGTASHSAGRAQILSQNVGGSAAASVGGPRDGQVSDEHARRLDVKAATLRGTDTVDGQTTVSPH